MTRTWDGDDGDALIGHDSGRVTVLNVEMSRLETPPVDERREERWSGDVMFPGGGVV